MRTPIFAASALCAGLLSGAPSVAQEANDEHHVIDEVVVTATPIARTVEQLAQPTAVISGENLARSQSTSIGETLADEPGVTATYFGPVASRPVIRGQYGERVRVLANGLDALDASALSEDHAVGLSSLLADRVEVVRGPATLLYGSGAAGGLVNIVDSRIATAPLEKSLSGGVSLGTDSATGKADGAVRIDAGTSAFAFHADWFRRDTDDVKIPGFAESEQLRALEDHEEHEDEEEEAYGIVENSDSRTEGGAAAISITGDESYVGLSVSRYTSNYGIPGGHEHHEEHEEGEDHDEEEEHEEEADVRVDLDQTRYDLAGDTGPVGFLDGVRFRIARNEYRHTELEGDEIGTVFDTTGTDARFEFRHRPGVLEGAIGLQYKHIDFLAQGEEAFVPGSKTEQSSLFAFEEYSVSGNLVLQGSARVEAQTIDAEGYSEYSETAVGGSLGAIWSLSGSVDLSANLALTERHPNATELYADGPHVAVQRYEIGSVVQGHGVLGKETSTNLDVTLRGEAGRLQYTITGFINAVDDYILLRPTADTIDELPVFLYAQADATLYGFEASALIELLETSTSHLHLSLTSDFVYGEEDDSGAYLPRIPPLRYGAGLHYTRGPFEASIDAVHHIEQNHTAANELPTDAYTLIGVEGSYAVNEELFLFVKGTNLGDEDARRHSSPLKDTVPLPGRSVALGLRWNF